LLKTRNMFRDGTRRSTLHQVGLVRIDAQTSAADFGTDVADRRAARAEVSAKVLIP